MKIRSACWVLVVAAPLCACYVEAGPPPPPGPPPPQGEVVVEQPPAPPPPEAEPPPPPPPTPDAYWVVGYHRWNGRAYIWERGHFEHRPHANARWVGAHWEHRGRGNVWIEARWE
jgi:hypothetical protein